MFGRPFPPFFKLPDAVVQFMQDGFHGDRQPCGEFGLADRKGFEPTGWS